MDHAGPAQSCWKPRPSQQCPAAPPGEGPEGKLGGPGAEEATGESCGGHRTPAS